MKSLIVAVLLSTVAPVFAQVVSRATDPPIVTAENDTWYRLREPLQFAGELYFPAGAAVFFNGNTMVRTGHYNGVPLYADTTIEPYSIVYVPIGRGVMQPYERVRGGELAGTSGSRMPAFPMRTARESREVMVAAVSPTAPPRPIGALGAFTPESGAVGTAGVVRPAAATTAPVALETLRRPESNDGIWLAFMGRKWLSAGPAVPLQASAFVRVGEHAGFPVFARQGLDEEIIYLPTRPGVVAPYRLKP
jgi:hypothetical protein